MEDRPPEYPAPEWPAPPEPPEPPAPPVIPWEAVGPPWATRLIDTIKLLFSRPREAFERMPLDSDLLKPFVFALVAGSIGFVLSLFWEGLGQVLLPPNKYTAYEIPAIALPFVALFSPLLIAIGVVINTLVFHLFLLMVGGARSGLGATMRVMCYAQAAQVLDVVPGCGSLLAFVAIIVFLVTGFSAAHRITTGRAGLAIALPVILCCACIVMLGITVGSAFLNEFGGGMPK